MNKPPKSLREQIKEALPEGWERSGATHCTHDATRACVWHSPGIGWWAAPRDAIMPSPPYEKWELRGGYTRRADAMTAAIELHANGGRYADVSDEEWLKAPLTTEESQAVAEADDDPGARRRRGP